jgi:hypothetical protein
MASEWLAEPNSRSNCYLYIMFDVIQKLFHASHFLRLSLLKCYPADPVSTY